MYQGDRILAESECDEVVPQATLDEVVPQATLDEVVPQATLDEVVPQATYDEVVPQSSHDEVLPNFLEADQLAAETSQPVPRARLSPRVRAGLWALRVFVLVVGAMVIYVFFAQLGH
jgi:hypothetical protein